MLCECPVFVWVELVTLRVTSASCCWVCKYRIGFIVFIVVAVLISWCFRSICLFSHGIRPGSSSSSCLSLSLYLCLCLSLCVFVSVWLAVSLSVSLFCILGIAQWCTFNIEIINQNQWRKMYSPAQSDRKEVILNCLIKLTVERVVCLTCACLLANRCLSVKCMH